MATAIQDWVPMYIKQDVNFRGGTTPTPERFNELYNLLIRQGDFNSLTLYTLLQNLEGFDVEFSDTMAQIDTRFGTLQTLLLHNLEQYQIDNAIAHNDIKTQMIQAVELMLQDYVTDGDMQSYFNQEADSILMSVSQTLEAYATKATLESSLELTSTSILMSVSNTLANYSTTSQMVSAIELTAGSITHTVNERVNGVETKATMAQQTADMFHWLVKSGDNETNFVLSDRLASLTSANIDLTGVVTFHSLADGDDVTIINGGHLKGVHIESVSGDIAGFDIIPKTLDNDGGFIYDNRELGKFIRFSPYSSLTGDGGFNPEYGAIDLGLAEDGMNTLIHLRSDGYGRFGLVNESGASVRFNDFLRYRQGVAGATDTILHSPKFKIFRDGKVESNVDVGEAAFNSLVRDVKFYNNGMVLTYEDEAEYRFSYVKNASGYITKLTNLTDGTVINMATINSALPS